jgi:hypothetical protein
VSVDAFAQVVFEAQAGVTSRSTMPRIDFEDRSKTPLLRAACPVSCRAQRHLEVIVAASWRRRNAASN